MKSIHRILQSLALTGLICSCSADTGGRESFGDKTEWSILQGLEYSSRGSAVAPPTVRRVDGYNVLRVPSASGKVNIWIMLRPEAAPFYKQMPRGDFHISQALLDNLIRTNQISSTVEEALASHVAE